ncbi:MAG: VWA domain-containing protein [Alphaproteobacteria bacterium]|nr:VWA domain-containing protein [Alphaproteobacteria bacterium]
MTEQGASGALAQNVMNFARLLRKAGLPVGPGKILTAIEALAAIDVTCQEDVYWALHAVLVERHAQSDLFSIAFERFWISRPDADEAMSMLDDVADQTSPQSNVLLPRRIAEAMADVGLANKTRNREGDLEIEASETWSAIERLRSKDFETMSADELAVTKRAMTDLRLPIPELPSRRFRPHMSGRRIDMRSTLRNTVRAGGSIDLKRKKRVRRHPPLVVLCDISGSMESYARMMLHFLHAITNDRDRVHTFLFGTRLTNVSRHLTHTDPDVALSRVGRAVRDWSGGTRIGETLAVFNRRWSRRVLGQGAVVLLITDGLDRDGGLGLAEEVERLQKSSRRLIWLNPLLRFNEFQPKSAGIKAMLPYVDDFRPVHSLDSLTDLAVALADPHSQTQWPHQYHRDSHA